MIDTKYNIGETINLPWTVASITVTENGARYKLESDATEQTLSLTENQIVDADCISSDTHEEEINELKEDIVQLKEMYQLEHMKYLKLKDDTKHSNEWRLP